MTEPVSPGGLAWRIIPPAQGNPVSAFGTIIRFHLGGGGTSGAYSLGLATTPPGVAPPLHVHTRDDEIFIVISGELSFHTPDGWRDVEPGTVVYMPKGVPHTLRNRGPGPSQHWVLTAPSGFEEFYARAGALLAAPGPPDREALGRTAAEYGYTIIGPPPPAESTTL